MLDTDTKRRIDTARDILVGKVPDPKSQVEQITIALIYKFMDDMDAESEELGGKRKFFTGDYARYGWAKLMRAGLGGNETLNLYAEGIAKMPENPGIPPLFRDIFKNAYLPYRDPETLKAFLKIIDGFVYDHSERLGDAFEYLLSVLGSQGDAGQFRTPRHIIDFIVAIVDPKKADVILDPACGTAGFLISAYKHILRSNTDAKGQSKLTPDDRGRLARNFKGYDISPDMVRLSLVNLYLHGFTDPHIYEYDTLTQDERWNEYADVILANPPFMSPKGGIKPHKRFSIQAKRSEVLFVDYMAEHLTPTGRAGIIVPEGVIFQSQTAYKELRKTLVEQYLVAVVSLPAGCFNPYSGVKTSILILDKSLAKQSSSIAFFKVENDGFGLGAQRRAIDRNDLPQVQAELTAYLQTLRSGASIESLQSIIGQIVPKERIAANGDYNLSGERYRDGIENAKTFPRVRLAEICEAILTGPFGSSLHQSDYVVDGIPVINPQNIIEGKVVRDSTKTVAPDTRDRLKEFCLRENDIIIARRGEMGRCGVVTAQMDGWLCGTGCFVIRLKPTCDVTFVFLQLSSPEVKAHLEEQAVGVTLLNLNQGILSDVQIPLPPLDAQKEIVAEIEGYQKVIDGARAVLHNYHPQISARPNWPIVELPELVRFQEGPGILAKDFRNEGVPLVRLAGLRGPTVSLNGCNFLDPDMVMRKWAHFRLEPGDILVSTSASFGRPALVDEMAKGAVFYTGLIRFCPIDDRLDAKYLEIFLGSRAFLEQGQSHATGSSIKHFGPMHLKQMSIPLPSIAEQQSIVAEVEAEQTLVNANRELIMRFEKKIQATLARVWGEEEPTAAVYNETPFSSDDSAAADEGGYELAASAG